MLKSASNYNPKISAAIFNASCCLHNVIACDAIPFSDKDNSPVTEQQIGAVPISYETQELLEQHNISLTQRRRQGEAMRDKIAGDMWRSYQAIMQTRRFTRV